MQDRRSRTDMKDLRTRFSILERCREGLDCLTCGMLFFWGGRPGLGALSESNGAELFT